MIPGLSFGSFALGLLAGVGGLYAYQAWTGVPTTANGAPASLGAPRDVLRGRVVPGPAEQLARGPARPGQAPRAGVATVVPYEWAYVVGEGDTAGSIAAAVTGDDARYLELLLANPALPALGEPGVYFGAREYQAAPGAMTPGLVLLFPIAWDKYVDQTGRVRGGPVPFPADGSGVDEAALAAAGVPLSLGESPGMGAALPPAAVMSTPADGVAASSSSAATAGSAGGANQHVQQRGTARLYVPPNPYYDERGNWRGRGGGPPIPSRMLAQVPQGGAAPYGAAFVPGGG